MALPWFPATPMHIDAARVELAYSSAARRFDMAPSVLTWGDSRLQLTGAIVHASQGTDGPGWYFDLKSTEGWLAPEPPQVQRLPIDQFALRGVLAPELGKVALSQFLLRAGGAEISAQGGVSNAGGSAKGQLDAKIGPMTAAVFKTLWPRWVAPARANLGGAAAHSRQRARRHVQGSARCRASAQRTGHPWGPGIAYLFR